MQKVALKKRDLYLKRMIAFQDTEMIKVITGIRRCGKSSLMKLMAQHLRENGITQEQILEMNFESMRFPDMDVRGFYEYVKTRILPDKRVYLFFDEVQRISGWENAVNSFRVDFDCDIYITGSNAYLLSSELSTYLSGRYVEIKMLPLSFREFLDFHGYTVTEKKSPTGTLKRRITDQDGDIYDERELFNEYARFGGMPMLADVGLEISGVGILDAPHMTGAHPWKYEDGEIFGMAWTYLGNGAPLIHGLFELPVSVFSVVPASDFYVRDLPEFSRVYLKTPISYCAMTAKCGFHAEAARLFGVEETRPLQCWDETLFDIEDRPVGYSTFYLHPDEVMMSVLTKF